VELVGVRRDRPRFRPDFFNGLRVENPETCRLRVGRTPQIDGLGAAFLERRIVEESVRFGIENFVGERRRLGGAGDELAAPASIRSSNPGEFKSIAL
jgi:hypothetical protein